MPFNRIFAIKNQEEFSEIALKIFKHQAKENPIYKKYISLLGKNADAVSSIKEIPFLPIQFFKEFEIITGQRKVEKIFTSSGTSGTETSKHFVTDLSLYKESLKHSFEQFYGDLKDYTIFALLPSYLERSGSSLIDMVDFWIKESKNKKSGFYLYNHEELYESLIEHEKTEQKAILIGVSFALLDFVEKFKIDLKQTIVMETGGMKGRREEITREELHEKLCRGFGTKEIHSEYGMTELLSQSYSKGNSLFESPLWMRILIRDTEDPQSILENGKTGGVNVIDLANINSCSFIATDDLGRIHPNGNFEILGRFDHSDVRGCNLLVV